MVLFRFMKRIIRTILWLIVIIVLIPIAGLAYGFLTTPSLDKTPLPGIAEGAPQPALAARVRAEIPGYQRPEESTFLTYPEWAIVYAAREYAGFVAKDQPSGFPYFAYVGRFWQDYAMVIRASSAYKFNYANHQMPVVIGTSHTIEHAVQWAYENTVGRITEAIAGRRTATDIYQGKLAAEYAAFLDQGPWYQFPYAEKRAGLFAVQPAPGDSAVRSSERKLAFGLADTIKQFYASLIRQALAATSDPALLDIHVWAKGPVGEATRNEADTLLERDYGPDGTVFVTKRYQMFTDMIPRLIDKGVSFVEIGGNDEIMITVLSTDSIAVPEGMRILFSYPLPADPSTRRTGMVVAVPRLHLVLPALIKSGARLEHVYDY
ncbi:hypothetical protein FJ959_21565 [Mesorhizobium sp. B2-2-4]|uniref:hypothetical protein n=2 Tax=unclassified Mesorhizobium TaxID=325217 RepID=UPI0011290050|nr:MULTISPECIES: hypothetical protein [unclassified Mesorhizobium]TPM44309.1 hypothetical protein FJ951_19650 [Mesorhizobium sp. B2-2-3]TPM53132.1 hypothetical protein FJ959_21565 [Mesorhizobium sp. B2-2-4]TPM62225.1 hypothetical protein FJ965_21810 [Mesorhizobium sp. B2-2-1]TPN68597.1 hypothetical protein FJ984_12290 [Mesorhizobium sp. B1-1-3]